MSKLRMLMFAMAAGILLTCALPLQAIPVFARKYGFSCTMCHSAFPRLNDFGVRYRENAYQLPGMENQEKNVLQTQAPFAARTTVGYNYDRIRGGSGTETVNQFQVDGLDILSGGLFKENLGYFMVYLPEIKGSRGVAAQTGTMEVANAVFSKLGSNWLNLRVGRFEPAADAFSVKRRLSVAPYAVYDFTFPSGVALSDNQTGIEAYGYGASGFKYAAGWVNGSDTNESGDSPADFYVRAAKVFGQGEGQTAGHMVGLTGYFGRARPAMTLPTTSRQSFHRIGADASLNFRQWNLSLQYLAGKDNAALWGAASDVDFNGGFAEVSYMPAFDLVCFARYDTVNPDDVSGMKDLRRWTLGGRYYFYENIALHMEYSDGRQNNVAGPDITERFFTTRLDLAF